jgi:hypothetical protein
MAQKHVTQERKTTAELGKLYAALTERETLELLNFCKRNLDAPAWLPLAVQKQLYAALVAERIAHSKTRDELSADLVKVRRAFKEAFGSCLGLRAEIASLKKSIARRKKSPKRFGNGPRS